MLETTLKSRLSEFVPSWRNIASDIKLTGVPRLLFLRSEWDSVDSSVVTIPYLIYRALFLSYFLVFLVFTLAGNPEIGYWPILATNWTFLAQTLYALLNFLNVFYFWCQEKCSREHPYYHLNVNPVESAIWFLMSLSYSVPQFISITFWLFVYGGNSLVPATAIGWSLTVHGINAILSWIDAVIVAAPLRVTHVFYPALMQCVYILFSYIYDVAGGTYKDPEKPYIYAILDWREAPISGIITLIAGTVTIVVFHFIFWVVVTIRIHYGTRYRATQDFLESLSGSQRGYFGERKPLLAKLSFDTTKA